MNALSPELIKKIRRIELRAGHLVNEAFSGGYLSTFKGQGMEWEDVRAYVPGDDVRRIDWKVTARLGETQIKQYREERENVIFLLIDVSRSGLFGTSGATRMELLAELAAALAYCAARSHDRLGVLFFSEIGLRHIAPGSGRAHVFKVIRDILLAGGSELALTSAQASFSGAPTLMLPAAERLCHLRKRRTVVFVLSDLWVPDLEEALDRMRLRHQVTLFWMRDQRELSLPPAGLVPVCDAESGVAGWIDLSRPADLSRFRECVARRDEEMSRLAHRCNVPLVRLLSNADYIDEVIKFFSPARRSLQHRRARPAKVGSK